MTLICLIIILVESWFFFLMNGKRMASPSFVACCISLFSVFLYFLYEHDYYGKEINTPTALILIGGLFFLFGGEMLGDRITFGDKRIGLNNQIGSASNSLKKIEISNNCIFLLFTISLIGGIVYFIDVYKFSLTLGNSAYNFWGMAEYVRHARNYGTGKVVYSSSTIVSQLSLIPECVVYFSIYAFSLNSLIYNEKKKLLLFPCLGYFPYVIACDNRSNLIKMTTIIFVIILCVYSCSKQGIRKINKKIIRISILIFIFAIVAFRILGYRTATSQNYDFKTNIVKYISSGLYGLDYYISRYNGERSALFGERAFRLVYMKLNDFGMSFELSPPNDLFYTYNQGESNIYTGYKPLIHDFGIIGAGIFVFIWGFITQYFLKKNNKGRCSLIKCVQIGLLFYPLTMISIGGEWGNVLSMSSIYLLFYTWALEKYVNYSNVKKKER